MSLTILFVWLFSLGKHKTLFENTITSSWILTTVLFQFLFIALFKGFKLKEDVGVIWKKIPFEKDNTGFSFTGISADSELEAIFYLIFAIPFIIVLILNATIFVWSSILIFIAILYWVFYRAIKFALRKSLICKDNIFKSVLYSSLFTFIYSAWFYLIILGVHYFSKN